jgi:hypothetical protein
MLTAIFYRRVRQLDIWTSRNTTESVFCASVKRAEELVRNANTRNAFQQALEVM